MVEPDRLMDLVNRIRSEKESDVPAGKIAERIELLKAVSMLDDMYKLHMTEDTAEISRLRFETTGKRRNYGSERRDIIEFGDLLKERLEQYFSGRWGGMNAADMLMADIKLPGPWTTLKPWPVIGNDMADKDRAQGKSKKAMTKKAKQKKKKDATPIIASRWALLFAPKSSMIFLQELMKMT